MPCCLAGARDWDTLADNDTGPADQRGVDLPGKHHWCVAGRVVNGPACSTRISSMASARVSVLFQALGVVVVRTLSRHTTNLLTARAVLDQFLHLVFHILRGGDYSVGVQSERNVLVVARLSANQPIHADACERCTVSHAQMIGAR